MTQVIKLKRSATAGNVPSTSQLALGELGINTADGKLYLKKSTGGTDSIIDVGDNSAYLPLTGGTLTGNLNFGDNNKANFGSSNDLRVYHDNTYLSNTGASFIEENGTGNLIIKGSNIEVRSSTNELYAQLVQDGVVQLACDNVVKFSTTSEGINVIGEVKGDSLEIDGNADITGDITLTGMVDGRDVATDGTKLDGIEASADVTDTTNVTAAGALMDSELTSIASVKALNQGVATTDSPTFAALTSTGEITANGGIALGDSDKATFGTGDDLQIYHDGSNSYITDTTGGNFFINDDGAGYLMMKGSDLYFRNPSNADMIHAQSGGFVKLYHNGVEKLATTSTGIDVTGEITADGIALGDNDKATFGSSDDLQIYHDGSASYISEIGNGNLKIMGSNLEMKSTSDEMYLDATQDGVLRLYCDNQIKLTTTSSGVTVAGVVTATGGNSTNWNTAYGWGNPSGTYLPLAGGTLTGSLTGTSANFEATTITGTGTSSSTYALRVYNNTPTEQFNVKDDGTITMSGNSYVHITKGLGAYIDNNLSVRGLIYNDYGDLELSGDVNITGTATMDGLTVDNSGTLASFLAGDGLTQVLKITNDATYNCLIEGKINGNLSFKTKANGAGEGTYFLDTDNKKRMFIEGTTGDISFYEDTGTTPKLFWDASAESLGIGTSSPEVTAHVSNAVAAGSDNLALRIQNPTNASDARVGIGFHVNAVTGSGWDGAYIQSANTGSDSGDLRFGSVTNNTLTERMRIEAGGQVVLTASTPSIKMIDSDDNSAQFIQGYGGGLGYYADDNNAISNSFHRFFIDGTEKVRIDSSGRVGINRTPSISNSKLEVGGADNVSLINVEASGNTGGMGIGSTGLQFFHGSSSKMTIDSSGNVGIGTSSPDTLLHVDGQAKFENNVILNENTPALIAPNGDLRIFTGGAERMRIDSSGNVGIGVSNVGAPLDIGSASPKIRLTDTGGGYSELRGNGGVMTLTADAGNNVANSAVTFETDGSERMRIDSSGNVGIGTASPSSELTIGADTPQIDLLKASSADVLANIRAETDAGSGGKLVFQTKRNGNTALDRMTIDDDGNVGIGTSSPDSGYKLDVAGNVAFGDGGGFDMNVNGSRWQFSLGGSEKMRIDSSGNLLVGKTSTSTSVVGAAIYNYGTVGATRDGSHALDLGRNNSDGDIAVFRKDGTGRGALGLMSNDLVIYSTTSDHSGLKFANGAIHPTDHTGTQSDSARIDLGSGSYRFNDIYARNSTILTSDRNEKQDIEELSDAEQRVAVRAKGLLRKFKWKDAVAEKGDDARIHFGIIAQDLQDAFKAEGLDAGDYGVFISNTWTNKDGEQQTRMGVRYSELLAFIISAI